MEKAPTEPAVEIAEPEVVVEQPATAFPFDREKIEKAFETKDLVLRPLLKKAKAYIAPVLDYMETVEARLQAADKNFQQIGTFLERMEPLVKLGDQIQQQRQTAAIQAGTATGGTAPGGFDINSILQLAPAFIGGGGDSEFAELGKKALMSQISMSNAITNAVVAKITGKATSEVAEAVTGA